MSGSTNGANGYKVIGTRPIRHEIGNPSRAWRTAGARTSAQGSRPHRDQLSHHASTQPGVVQDDADRRGTDAAP